MVSSIQGLNRAGKRRAGQRECDDCSLFWWEEFEAEDEGRPGMGKGLVRSDFQMRETRTDDSCETEANERVSRKSGLFVMSISCYSL